MGIQFLKYLSQILQIFALIFWTGSLVMIVFILFPLQKRSSELKAAFSQLFLEAIHKLEYVFIFAIISLWSGILIHLTTASSNPLKSKFYILYILLSFSASFITLIKIFWIQYIIAKSEKSIKLFPQNEFQNLLENRVNNYKKVYFYLSFINLLIISTIILINQF